MRDAFGEALVEIGKANPDLVALTADLAEATRVHHFAEEFPDRFFQMGISESDMMGTAAGLALGGKIPVATTFAIFATSLANQPIRLSVGYNAANVKICTSHGGVTVGADGATHQAFEDIALMRSIPGMTVVVPADAHEARAATRAVIDHKGPVYLRLGRVPTPIVTASETPFDLFTAPVLREGADVAILATGIMVPAAMEAAEALTFRGIQASVVNVHTVKPLDETTILRVSAHCGAVVTAEEHSIIGGLGGAVAELLGSRLPTPLERVGVADTFGESGEPDEILHAYGLTSEAIQRAAISVVDRARGTASGRP
jgi:transketolase